MAQDDGSELYRLDPYEQRLIRNYRKVNESRQDTLLFFSDELVKLEIEDRIAAEQQAPSNVVPIKANRGKPRTTATLDNWSPGIK